MAEPAPRSDKCRWLELECLIGQARQTEDCVILFDWFRRRQRHGSAPVARDRLTVLLAHERTQGAKADLLDQLRGELVAAICRHVTIVPDKVQVKMDHHQQVSTLAIEIEIPA